MRVLGLLVACVAVGLVAADAPKELQGAWSVTKMERGGKENPDAVGDTLTVNGDKFTIKPKKGDEMKGTLKVDSAKKPFHVDMKMTTPDGQERTMEGLLKIDGDTAVFCFPKPGDARPKEIAATEDTMVVTLKREKK